MYFLFLIYQDDPDYLEDCTGDQRCTNGNETCVVELISELAGNYTNSLYKNCSFSIQYNDPQQEFYVPLWQECFCLPQAEFMIVKEDDLPKDEKPAGNCKDGGGTCPFPSFGTFIRYNSATVSIFPY